MLSHLEQRLTAIATTETWLNSNNHDTVCIPGYNFVSKSRPVKRGGGVGLFINEMYTFIIRDDLCRMYDFIECIFVEIPQENKRNLLLGCVYRPPNSDVVAFNAELLDILNIITSQKQMNVCIAGDCNLDLLKSNDVDATSEFINNLTSHFFTPVITSPTRITTTSATVIDNIFINCNNIAYDSAGIYCDISDHLPIGAHIELKLDVKKNSQYIYKRFFTQNNLDAFTVALRDTSWEDVLQLSQASDPDAAYTKFLDTYCYLFDVYFPLKN